jgi:Zn-dependent peptidase ImmA (M78 family)
MTDVLKISDRFRDTAPVPVFDVIRELGLGLEFQALDDDVSGWIEAIENGGYKIVINSQHAATRQRFTAAHELGHFIYHRDLLGEGTGDTRAYRTEHSPLPNARIRPRHERQANSFAANFLMPVAGIERLRASGISDVAKLAERFGVSVDAMRIRLGSSVA